MTHHLYDILSRNFGNVLTPELVAGILQAASIAPDQSINIEDIPPIEYDGAVIHVERMQAILPEIVPLHAAHWAETEKYRHGVPLNVDYDHMVNAERQGRFILFTVRRDGALVGNCAMYLTCSTHTQQWVAEEDTLFILSEHRRGRLAIKLIQYVEDVLKNMGITEIRVTVKTVNRVGDLLERLGYAHTANQLVKVL